MVREAEPVVVLNTWKLTLMQKERVSLLSRG